MNGESPYPRWTLEGHFKDSRTCPRTLVTSDSAAWLRLHNHYVAGHLLERGGLLDQPAVFLDAMRAIDAALNEAQRNG